MKALVVLILIITLVSLSQQRHLTLNDDTIDKLSHMIVQEYCKTIYVSSVEQLEKVKTLLQNPCKVRGGKKKGKKNK